MQTVVTTEDGEGGSTESDHTKVVSPPAPPAESEGDEEGGDELANAAFGAAGAAVATAFAPGAGEAGKVIGEKVGQMAQALAKFKVEFERATSQSSSSSESNEHSDEVTTVMAQGGDAFAPALDGELIVGLDSQVAGFGNGLVELSSEEEKLSLFLPLATECTPENSLEIMAMMPTVAQYQE